MLSIEVRPFRRGDREQLTHLVNVHAAAVIPGMSVSVNAVMNQLEREPAEFVVDPWVAERATLVAEQRARIVAAAHLLRYAADEHVGNSYRHSAEIRWFLFWPEAPYWPDSTHAADALITACVAQLDGWGVSNQGADGALPVPGVYGVPEQWPHVRGMYERAGFVHEGRTEVIYIANVDEIPRPPMPRIHGLTLARSVGINGTRFSAALGAELVGYIEVQSREEAGRAARSGGWADIGNLNVAESHPTPGSRRVARWAGRRVARVRAARSCPRLRVPRPAGVRGLPAQSWFQRTYAYGMWLAEEAASILTNNAGQVCSRRAGRSPRTASNGKRHDGSVVSGAHARNPARAGN